MTITYWKMKVAIVPVLLISTILSFGQAVSKPFSWPGKTRAAVCLTYDDGLDCHIDNAVPALDKYDLKGTFFCTGMSSSLQHRMDEWQTITENGHELGNHSLFHPCDGERGDWVTPEYDLNNYSMSQIINELFTANSLLKAVDGKTERTYAYTCSDFKAGQQSFVDSIRGMFVAARNDGAIPESIEEIDLHFVPSWGVVNPSGKALIEYVKKAQEKGTLAVIMFHSVGGGYLNVSLEAHNELLAYLHGNKEEIWTGTFLDVMSYIKMNRSEPMTHP
jgi:peptidoglycan/xylan/chitin deacetylase (PgdA/CDA1 family)